MSDLLSSLEVDLRWLGGIAGLGTLAYSITRMMRAQAQPASHYTGASRQVLRTRYLVIATLVFFVLAVSGWRPIPIGLPTLPRLVVSLLGTVILCASLGLYIWGLHSLDASFNASSGFGVRLQQGHRLVTSGPYAYLRHPMYLAVILAGWSGLLLFRTWTMLVFAVMMFGLIVRAHREEQALAEVFGRQWELYKRSVPGWFPRMERLLGRKGG